ncbi:flippase [Liquorilactobacillus satsumensis]|uniref:flippase n=1 Tax=Liquorilactobacillus satsumensis TaxID=259059 RepID=UPI001E32DC4E|nr:flippase [Liquorilactobacillus satsumensis]MCC7667097.1 flippase [Liquorilactobacillus satsumensis]MCP9358245.1 flippase [Liquorilactobacillus satsumensis]MCP9372199.1 flippase [Liquorilactobacillus satsumensis]
MHSKSLKINYIYNLLYQFLAIAVPLLTTPYVSRVLGARNVGLYNYTLGIVYYFGIFAVTGTATYGQREVATRQNDKKERSRIFWEVFIFRFFCVTIVFLIYTFFLNNFMLQYKLLFLVNIFTIFSWLVDVSWYFQGVENFKVTAIRNSMVKLVATVLIFTFIKNPTDLWLYTLIYALSNFAGNLTMIPQLFSEVMIVKISFRSIMANFRGIMELFIPVVAIQLYTVLNKIMLGSMSSATQVGYYSQANQIINVSITVIYAFVAVLTPRIAFLYKEGNMDEVKRYIRQAFENVYMLSVPMFFGSICIADLFVPIFFGSGYKPVIYLIYIMSFLFVIIGLGQLLGTFLIATNRQNNYTVAVSMAALINLILNFILLSLGMKAVGVSIATLVAELIATLIQVYALKDLINFKILNNNLYKYIVSSILMCLAIIFVRMIFVPELIALLASLFIAIVCYFSTLIILRDSIFYPSFKKIINKIKKQ